MRSQFSNLFVGAQRTGKSHLARQIANAYTKSVLVVCPDDQEKIWRDYPVVTIQKLPTFKGKAKIIFDVDDPFFIPKINSAFKNGLIIFDDSKVYVRPTNYPYFEKMIVRRRQSNIDLIFMYQGFTRVAPLLWAYCSHLFLWRTKDFANVREELNKKRALFVNDKARTAEHHFEIFNLE